MKLRLKYFDCEFECDAPDDAVTQYAVEFRALAEIHSRRERRLVEALKLAATRLEILTGRMRACGNHELLEEAVMFCEEARASLVTREHRLVEQARAMAEVLRDMDEAKWLDEADRILQTRGREALAAWRSLVIPSAAPTGGGK